MPHDSLIFDLDGTLWDTCDTCAVGWNNVLTRHNIPFRPVTGADVRGVTGMPHETCIRTVFQGLAEEHLSILNTETMIEDVRVVSELGATLYEGVREGLGRLACVYPLFIVSNCQKGYIETFFAWSKLQPHFKDYECWGNTGRPKGENLRAIVERNNLLAPLYIGDTEGDQAAAKFAGVPFALAAYGFGDIQNAEYTFPDFKTLTDHFTDNHPTSNERPPM